MKIIHNPEIDYLSIDFKEGIEARSYFKDGIIVREDAGGNVLGIDITDSSKLFFSEDLINLKDACRLLNISESTMRRRIKGGQIKYIKKRNRYRFKKEDILTLR